MTFNTGFSRGVVRIGLCLLMGSPGIALSQTLPNLPVIGDISCGTSNGTTIVATTAAQFRTALTTAVYGDTITLTAGANFVGPFTLPVKSGTGCITIRTSAPDSALPAAGARITPAYASVLPKIVSPGSNEAAVQVAYGAHHYKFIGVEFMPVSQGTVVDTLIVIGDGNMTSLSEVPHHIELDRVYVHAFSATSTLKRAIGLQGASVTIKNSYISGAKAVGIDSQAIAGWNGPGPFRINNNYIEAAAENLLFGGAEPHIPNLIPSNIEITHNLFSKPLSWRIEDPTYAGTPWTVKNLFELKLATRVLIDGNIFEYCWPHGQIGYAVVFTVRNEDGNAPWAAVQDVTFTNNLIRHATHGMYLLGTDYNHPSQLTQRILIKNNLWLDIGYPYTTPGDGGSGRGLFYGSDGGAADNVTVEHNTFFHGGTIFLPGDTGINKGRGFTWRNNIHPHNEYGVLGGSSSIGAGTLDKYFAIPYVYANNVMIANPYPQLYPTGNFNAADLAAVGFTNVTDVKGNGTDYSLLPTSPYHNAGTDGTDIGVNWTTLRAATSTTYSGGIGSGSPSGGTGPDSPPTAPKNLTVR